MLGISSLARSRSSPRMIGDAEDADALAAARAAAEAELELARVRRVRIALIERAIVFGRSKRPKVFKSPKDEAAWIMQHYWGVTLWKNRPKFADDNLPEMPTEEPQRTVEAVRRIIPDLLKLYATMPRSDQQRPRDPQHRATRCRGSDSKKPGVLPVFCRTNPIFDCAINTIKSTSELSSEIELYAVGSLDNSERPRG